MSRFTTDALASAHSQRELDMIEDGPRGGVQGATDALTFAQGDTAGCSAMPVDQVVRAHTAAPGRPGDGIIATAAPATPEGDAISREAALLPCPFCGGDVSPNTRNGMTWVYCRTCTCATCMYYGLASAAAAWNRRAPASAVTVKAVPRPTFPILGSNGARIDYQLVADHGGQAKENHYQTVERLAQRGGLSWAELHAVLHNRKFAKIDQNDAITECRAIEARYLAALSPAEQEGGAV